MKSILKIILAGLLLASCEREPTKSDQKVPAPSAKGAFIVNEGSFSISGEISYYDLEKDIIYNDIFKTANSGEKLGSFPQSVTINDSLAYIVVSGSHKIEVVSTKTYKRKFTINMKNGKNPRYIAMLNSTKAYITNNGDYSSDANIGGFVTVFNPSNWTITIDSIKVKTVPEGIVIANAQEGVTKVYVSNQGLFSNPGKFVSVMNPNTDIVEKHIEVGTSPSLMKIAPNGKIYVACSGKMYVINPLTDTVVDTFSAGSSFGADFDIDKNGIGYIVDTGGITKFDTNTNKILSKNFISGGFYTVAINGNNGDILVTDAGAFQSAGKLYIYDSSGSKKKEFTVGVGPGFISWKF